MNTMQLAESHNSITVNFRYVFCKWLWIRPEDCKEHLPFCRYKYSACFLASIYEQMQKILRAAGCSPLINLEAAVAGGSVVTLIKGNRKWQLMFGLKVLYFCAE